MKLDRFLSAVERWGAPVPRFDAPADVRDAAGRIAAAGREHLLAARAAADQRLPGSAASLYGRAIAQFTDAKALLEAGKVDAERAPVDAASVVLAASGAWIKPAPRADAVLLLREPQAASTLSMGRRGRALRCLERLATGAGREVYPVSDSEVRWLRVRRGLGTAVTMAAAVAAIVLWIKSPHNVARGKPVTASSVRMGAPQALTNGAIEWGTFGLHTGGSGSEWARIDLLKFYELDFAEIYSRGEGRFEFNIPLNVETSADGTTFKLSGACKEVFTQATPCVVDLHRVRARYVRISAPEIVLAEVEVYGK
jgi:hypothetical protein